MKIRQKFFSLFLAVTILLGATNVYAAPESEMSEDNIEIIFTDVTDSRTDVLEGEAKIMVSVKGASGIASIAQTSLKFSGDLKYKSITFLQGENNPPKCFLYSPNAALVNSKKTLMPSIISTDKSVSLSGQTDLFVLTFAGEPGEEVTLSTNDLDNTYCIVDGEEITAQGSESITVAASEKAVRGKTATIQLEMDVVSDFYAPASSGYQSSGIEIRITGTENEGYTIYTVLNNANISKGGHRVGSGDVSIPTFIIENTVLADDTYTVEISGIGYIPLVLKKVDFDEPLELNNSDFVPGDVDGDGEITEDDIAICTETAAEEDYSEACDFNRDGEVDKYDLAVFDKIGSDDDEEEDKATAPAKITNLTAKGGEKLVELKWTAPDDCGSEITGYTVKYGKSKTALTSSEKTSDTEIEIDGLSDDTTYYFTVVATNEIGDSDPSDVVSAKTNTAKEEEEEITVPDPVTEISHTAAKTYITLEWDAPESDGGSPITKYTVKYGKTKTNLRYSKTVTDLDDGLSLKISGLAEGTTYYFSIIAENENGQSEPSEPHKASTNASSGGGGGGGGGGGSGGGGATPPPVSTPTYYTVTYEIGTGTIASGAAAIKVEKNEKPHSVPEITAPEGKEFAGWSRDNGVSFIDPTNVTVTANITFTAIYKDIVKEDKLEAPDTPETVEVFTDLENHKWAKDAIYELKSKGIINGTSETTYAPANNIKRGDFILILVRMLEIDAEYTDNFADVPADKYYADAIGKAKAAGIAKGSGDNFMPEETITRQDLITLAYRAFLAKGYITETDDMTSLDSFSDKEIISDYALSSMASMVKAGIIKGSDKGEVNPKNNATRAEVAVMCSRLLALMK